MQRKNQCPACTKQRFVPIDSNKESNWHCLDCGITATFDDLDYLREQIIWDQIPAGERVEIEFEISRMFRT